jgi:hypothetical protein
MTPSEVQDKRGERRLVGAMPVAAHSSILDIDLDYFNLADDPVRRLRELLAWAGRPVDFEVERHHQALGRWRTLVKRGRLAPPTHILHVDEHHDMMDEQSSPNIANFICHAMRQWPECRVHWLVDEPIDSPNAWLDDSIWAALAQRFSMGTRIPTGWPKPDLVSVCTSPEFVPGALRERLVAEISVAWLEGSGGDSVDDVAVHRQ